MWRAQLNRAIKEVRFVLKPGAEHHGTWRFIETKLSSLRMVNQNTFFSITPIPEQIEAKSAVWLVYGDMADTEDSIETDGLSLQAFENILKEKVEYGLRLSRHTHETNADRDIPISIVEAHKYVNHVDDQF